MRSRTARGARAPRDHYRPTRLDALRLGQPDLAAAPHPGYPVRPRSRLSSARRGWFPHSAPDGTVPRERPQLSQPMSSTLLDCVVLEPQNAPGGRANASVIWLHGLGANGHDFPPIVPELGLPKDHGIRFVFPHAPSIPVTINGGMVMPAWYDILSLESIREVDEAGVRLSAERVEALIAAEREKGIPANRIVLAGFSQGGAIALHAGLRHAERLAGLVLLSTYMACDANVEAERSPANQEVPILQCHGVHDPMVRLSMGESARDRMQELGYSVDWHTYPMMHQVVMEEVETIGAFLQTVLP